MFAPRTTVYCQYYLFLWKENLYDNGKHFHTKPTNTSQKARHLRLEKSRRCIGIGVKRVP